PNQNVLHDYASAGGRVFASHFHYPWFNAGPYATENLATWTTGANSIAAISAVVASGFPDAIAMGQWLTNVGALSSGALPIDNARHNADVSAANVHSNVWLSAPSTSTSPNATELFSFDTPTNAALSDAGVAETCGRVVYTELHVAIATGDNVTLPVPTGCSVVDLSPQEKALEYMLFDLSACTPVLP
ncbi:MAG: hypothetical protein ACHREM_23975, partial [Polyangiales bacterium]